MDGECEVPDDDELNSMMAVYDSEIALFQSMDVRREKIRILHWLQLHQISLTDILAAASQAGDDRNSNSSNSGSGNSDPFRGAGGELDVDNVSLSFLREMMTTRGISEMPPALLRSNEVPRWLSPQCYSSKQALIVGPMLQNKNKISSPYGGLVVRAPIMKTQSTASFTGLSGGIADNAEDEWAGADDFFDADDDMVDAGDADQTEMNEDGDDVGDHPRKRSKKRSSEVLLYDNMTDAQFEQCLSNGWDGSGATEMEAPRPRKRGRPSNAELARARGEAVATTASGPSSSSSSSLTPGRKSKKPRLSSSQQDDFAEAEVAADGEMTPALVDAAIRVVEAVARMKPATLFVELPDRVLLPEYYDHIKRPVALSTIMDKLRASAYDTQDALTDDFWLMAHNAREFNGAASPIFKDSEYVRKQFHEKMKAHASLGWLDKPRKAAAAAK